MHATLSPEEADRLAIRDLFDAYAQCADTRDAAGQMADSHLGLHPDRKGRM